MARSDTHRAPAASRLTGMLWSEATGVLWSAVTAREIVAVIVEDADVGLLLPTDATDLIDRVWARATPAPGPSTTPRGAGRCGPDRCGPDRCGPARCGR